MKKLESKEQIARKEKRNRVLIGGLFIFLLVFSTLGYALLSGGFLGGSGAQVTDEEFENSLEFDNQVNRRFVDGKDIVFTSSFEDVKDIDVQTSKTFGYYSGKQIYIVGDDVQKLGEVARAVGQFAAKMQQACLGACEDDFPEKSCEDDLIVLKDSEINRVYEEGKCVFIEGDSDSVDAFLYRMSGVVE